MPDAEESKCRRLLQRILTIITVCCLLFAAGLFVLVIYIAYDAKLNGLVKFYILINNVGLFLFSCPILLLAEIDWQYFVDKYILFLRPYLIRGICLVWLGPMLAANAETIKALVKSSGESASTADFAGISAQVDGWLLIACGICHIVGACFFQRKNSEGRSTQSSGSDGNKKELREKDLIIENMALALNMSTSEAKKKFAGSDGAKTARNMMKQSKDYRDGGSAPVTMKSAASNDKNDDQRPSSITTNPYAAESDPPARGESRDDDGGRKKDDAAALEAEYYAQYNK